MQTKFLHNIKWYKPFLVFCVLVIQTLFINQVFAQVEVNLRHPPFNQLKIEHLWNLTLTNTTQDILPVYLYGTLTESKAGLIATGTSTTIQLPPGVKTYTAANYQELDPQIDYRSSDPKYEESVMRTGGLPSGDYEICVYVRLVSNNNDVGDDCIQQNIELMPAPSLIAPDDGDALVNKNPAFTWMHAVKPRVEVSYKIRIVEIYPPEDSYTAMQNNPAWFEEDNIRTTVFQYPVSAREFPDSGMYAWQVIAFDPSGNPLGESEVFSFSMRSASCGTVYDSLSVDCMGWDEATGFPKYSVTVSLYNAPTTTPPTQCDAEYYDITTVPPNTGTITDINILPLNLLPTTTGSFTFTYSPPNSSTTSVTFKVWGNWDDPDQNTVNNTFDPVSLPNCLCNDCDTLDLSFNNFVVTLQGTDGNQYNITGDVISTAPVYGLEFQIQSFDYTAEPEACSNGVTSLEESGMFLIPSTTINGYPAQMFNETASGSANTNNNASKIVKYISTTAMTGNIPVNFTIGLPGPLPGLCVECCEISYKICIKVRVFYGEESCKSCTFIHCFEFNNQ